MVNDSASLDAVFGALADPTRRAILMRLAKRPLSVSELADPLTMSLPAASKHIRVLERAGLLRQTKVGRVRRCEINPVALDDVHTWMAEVDAFWTERLDALGDFLKAQATEEGTKS
jgi:DNA-binding transcriptional ArsR family regulator